jgi:hypothetical protein
MTTMDEYREELASLTQRCRELGIEHDPLTIADVMAITGRSRPTVRSWFKFGGGASAPRITRRQLARQLYELTRYSVREVG